MDLAKPITQQQLVLRSADSVRVRENPNSQAAHSRAAGVLQKATRATVSTVHTRHLSQNVSFWAKLELNYYKHATTELQAALQRQVHVS